MKTLGMSDAFSPGIADFSEWRARANLHFGHVAQSLCGCERGRHGSTATAIAVGMTSMPAESYTINFDHPFIFLIRDIQTNTILFIGTAWQIPLTFRLA